MENNKSLLVFSEFLSLANSLKIIKSLKIKRHSTIFEWVYDLEDIGLTKGEVYHKINTYSEIDNQKLHPRFVNFRKKINFNDLKVHQLSRYNSTESLYLLKVYREKIINTD